MNAVSNRRIFLRGSAALGAVAGARLQLRSLGGGAQACANGDGSVRLATLSTGAGAERQLAWLAPGYGAPTYPSSTGS